MAAIKHRPGDIHGETILVALVAADETILGILPEHQAAVLELQDWIRAIESVGLQTTFGIEEGFWEVMERLGYYADKEDYQDRDNMTVELWTHADQQPASIAGLRAYCAALKAKALALKVTLPVT